MANETNAKQYSLTWKGHIQHVQSSFVTLLTNSDFCDVTLYAEGRRIGAHKVFLISCSGYFGQLFDVVKEEHPIIVLKDVKFHILQQILSFIYTGQVCVEISELNTFLETAEFLKIAGLVKEKITSDTVSNRSNSLMSDTDNANYPRNEYRQIVECASITSNVDDDSSVSQVSTECLNSSRVTCQTHLSDESSLTERLLQSEGYSFFKGHSVLQKIVPETVNDNVPESASYNTPESGRVNDLTPKNTNYVPESDDWTSDYEYRGRNIQSDDLKDLVPKEDTLCHQSDSLPKRKRIKLEITSSDCIEILDNSPNKDVASTLDTEDDR